MALAPTPFRSAVAIAQGLIGRDWHEWLRQLAQAVDAAAQRVGTLPAVAAQGAALAAQTIVTAPVTGLYRVGYYLRVTRAATVSSSATVTMRWTDGGVACLFTFGALTGNTVDTVGSALRDIRADKGSAITIEVAYASVGATSMQFGLEARAELLP